MAGNVRAWRGAAGMACLGALLVVTAVWPATSAQADTITLKNGMRLEGAPSTIGSVAADPLKGVGATDVKPILVVDNQLTRTFVRAKEVTDNVTAAGAGQERVPIFQRTPAAGNPISAVGRPLRIDPFDEYGHRIFSMTGPKGPIEVVQGITEITPKWTKVEAIEGIHHYKWTMQLATTSIPRDELAKILKQNLDVKNPDQRIRIVRLYMQLEWFPEAREELRQIVKDFPALEHLKDVVKELNQLNAQTILKEIERRREAGQYNLASVMLQSFPSEGMSGEMLLRVRELLDDLQTQQQQGTKVLKLIDDQLALVKSDATKKQAESVVKEIRKELNINNLDRFADFLRLADDNKMSAEQKLALAISGWLMGSGEAVDGLDVSLALVAARDIAQRYMSATRKVDQDNLVSQLPSEVTIDYMAKIVGHMKPPVETVVAAPAVADVGKPAELLGLPGKETPNGVNGPAGKKVDAVKDAGKKAEPKGKTTPEDDSGSCAPKSKEDDSALLQGVPKPVLKEPKQEGPAATETKPQEIAGSAVQATEIPGLYRLSVPTNMQEQPVIHYWVQTPPEYDPYRRYPCIVTLAGSTRTPAQQIDWWAGDYSPKIKMRKGQATRHGYIVIAPEWSGEYQLRYEFSSREHAAVLKPLNDACKRFSIDTDRVFLTGHSLGATAAWDIALAHPDLWAGLLPIVPVSMSRSEKPNFRYISQYKEHGKYVPMYFVCGEKDSGKWASAPEWNTYLTKLGYDTTVVEYLGRGHEFFSDEIQNMFTWMGLHKRNFFPKDFQVESLRPWDKFFWWVETDDPRENSVILPAEWGELPVPAKTPQAAVTTAKPNAPNGVRVTNRGCGAVRVWLSPEIVTFNNTLKVVVNNDTYRNVQPRIETLLEDVRTRGDRQHPFWAKVDWPAK